MLLYKSSSSPHLLKHSEFLHRDPARLASSSARCSCASAPSASAISQPPSTQAGNFRQSGLQERQQLLKKLLPLVRGQRFRRRLYHRAEREMSRFRVRLTELPHRSGNHFRQRVVYSCFIEHSSHHLLVCLFRRRRPGHTKPHTGTRERHPTPFSCSRPRLLTAAVPLEEIFIVVDGQLKNYLARACVTSLARKRNSAPVSQWASVAPDRTRRFSCQT